MKALADLHAATLEHVAQMSAAIAPAMTQEDIVVGPQKRMRGNGDEQLTRRRQHAAHGPKQAHIVVHVFEDVHEDGAIHRPRRHLIQVRADHEPALDASAAVVHVDCVDGRVGQCTESARKVQVAGSHIGVSGAPRVF